jgi:nucleoside-diphosphate-sugar epimerase
MTVLVSGGTGFVGRFIVAELAASGRDVRVLARHAPEAGTLPAGVSWTPGVLDPQADHAGAFAGIDAFVHAAFDHVPGRYRGGEGDDPGGFRRRNLDGTVALFETARRAGVGRAVFLSSRAVYGAQLPGAVLREETATQPDTLYGAVKLEAERALEALGGDAFIGVSLRVTGVYGPGAPGRPHKWSGLVEDYLAGRPVASRVATEVHGRDVARAVRLMLDASAERLTHRLFNVSDLVLDRRDLLLLVQAATGCLHPLPERAAAGALNVMETRRLTMLGWTPGGQRLLQETVMAMPEVSGAARR